MKRAAEEIARYVCHRAAGSLKEANGRAKLPLRLGGVMSTVVDPCVPVDCMSDGEDLSRLFPLVALCGGDGIGEKRFSGNGAKVYGYAAGRLQSLVGSRGFTTQCCISPIAHDQAFCGRSRLLRESADELVQHRVACRFL